MASTMVIDCLEFAHAGQELQGTVSVAELGRLADRLFDVRGALNFRMVGGSDDRQRPRLMLGVDGEINLKCQRCLGSLAFSVAVESSLLVLTAGSSVESSGIDDLDGVPADAHTDVWTLVEDEVLLAIPFAPRHAEGQCSMSVGPNTDRIESAFSVLAKNNRN